MKLYSQNVAIVHRISYKVMNTILTDILYSSQLKGVTTLFLKKIKNNAKAQKTIIWEVNLSERWVIDGAQPKPPQIKDEPKSIIEHPYGKVSLDFAITSRSYFSSRRSISSLLSEVGSFRSVTSSLPNKSPAPSIYRSPSIQPSGIAFPYHSKRKDDNIQSVKLFEFDFDATISTISLIRDKDKTSDFIINKEYLQNEMSKHP